MKRCTLTISTLLGAFSASNASPFKASAKALAFVHHAKSIIAIPRRGTGPIKPDVAAVAVKISGTVYLLQGSYCTLALNANADTSIQAPTVAVIGKCKCLHMHTYLGRISHARQHVSKRNSYSLTNHF